MLEAYRQHIVLVVVASHTVKTIRLVTDLSGPVVHVGKHFANGFPKEPTATVTTAFSLPSFGNPSDGETQRRSATNRQRFYDSIEDVPIQSNSDPQT